MRKTTTTTPPVTTTASAATHVNEAADNNDTTSKEETMAKDEAATTPTSPEQSTLAVTAKEPPSIGSPMESRPTRPLQREQLKERIRQNLDILGPPQTIKKIRRQLNAWGRDLVVTEEGMRATVDDADLASTLELREILTEILGESFPFDA